VLITDRGEIVAELSPPKKGSRPGEITMTLEEMRQKGVLYGGAANDAKRYPAMPRALKRSSVHKLLDEERGSR
jgi:hypothetical protein